MHYRSSKYQDSHLLTASPGDVLLALYDGALRFIGRVRVAIEEKDFPAKAEAMARSLAVFEELTASLDHRRAPALCGQLASLYGYFLARLNKASIELNASLLVDVERHLIALRDVWQTAVLKARQEGFQV